MRVIFPLIALVLAILCAVLLQQLNSAHENIAALRKKLSLVSTREAALPEELPIQAEGSSADSNRVGLPLQPSPSRASARSPSEADNEQQRARFLAAQEIEEVQKLTALSETEQEELTRALEDRTAGGGPAAIFSSQEESDAQLRAAMTEVLGAERTADFFSRRAADEQRQRAGRLELQIGTLARKLALTATQEQDIRSPLEELNANAEMWRRDLRTKMRELTAKHFGAGADPEELRQGFEQMKQMGREIKDKQREMLNAKLRPILNDEQFNTLLAEQGTSPDALFGIPGF
ncbi:MAG: hypothetical protein K1X83_08375 [Oligoflexia bacterium]|nr:hypothetical protein [Oligoflexia bacterium]